jgi:hypothetical protein
VCYLYDFGCPRPTVPIRGATCSSVPLWLFLVSIHGVTFTVADGTMYFVLNLVEVTKTMHIIVITLLHIVHLVMEALLLLPTLPQFSRGHIRYIVYTDIQWPLRRIQKRLKSGLSCLLLSR